MYSRILSFFVNFAMVILAAMITIVCMVFLAALILVLCDIVNLFVELLINVF